MGINKKFVAKNGVDNNSQRLTNVATPSEQYDAANKAYVDNMAAGLDTKQSVKVASTTDINLSAGQQTIDGVSVVFGDRVLVKNQTNSTENGIYVVTTNTWYRPDDINTWSQFPGAFTFVEQGTTNADTGWVCIANPGGTIGVTPITWTQFTSSGSSSITTLKVNDGTAITPSISFLNDTNSGLYRESADTISLVTGGVDRLKINEVGQVGIGTNPTVPLEVRKSAPGSNVIQRVGVSGQTKNPYLESKFNETSGLVTLNASGSSTPAFTFEVDQSEKMRIDTSGNLGIGTKTPNGKLDVNGNINISGTSSRITGNFSDQEGVLFQTTVSNANTNIGAIPNGTSSSSYFVAYSNPNISNASFLRFGVSYAGRDSSITSYASGSAEVLPILIKTGTTERMRVTADGKILIGNTNLPFKTEVLHVKSETLGSVANNEVINSCSFMPDGNSTGLITKTVRVTNGSSHTSSRNIIQRVVDVTPMGYIGFDSNNAVSLGYGSSSYFNIDTTGNINIPKVGARITGDFSNATVSNRLMIQSSTTNGNTLVGAVPNGTGSSAGWYAFSAADPSNASYAGIASSNGVSNIVSGITGTGTYQPLIMTTGGSERMRIDANGSVGIGRTPSYSLDVGNDIGQQIIRLNGAGSGNAAGSALYLKNGTSTHALGNYSAIAGGAYDADLSLWSGSGSTRFYNGGAERMRIDTNGNVGIGETNPTGWNSKLAIKGTSGFVQSTVISTGSTSSDVAAHTVASASGNYTVSTQAYGDGLVQINLNGAAGKDKCLVFRSSNSARWICGSNAVTESGSNAGSNFIITRLADNGAYLGTPLTIYRNSGEAYFEGIIAPTTDNTKSNGEASNRWSVVYAGTGTINTSDAREKNEVRSLTENEIQAAQALSKEIGAYKFLSSIAEKGDVAREHIGMTVQRAIEVMESFNLNPFNYGFICYDEWDQQTETIPAVEASEEVLGEDGTVVKEAVEAKPEEIKIIREAGNRYSFRMDELSMFIARGVSAKLESIEARLAALEV